MAQERFDALALQQRIAANYRRFRGEPGLGPVAVVDGDQPPERVTAAMCDALLALGYNEREALSAMKGLAEDVGVSDGIRQALLYRYFESKDALVEAVFQRVAAGRWTQDYPALIADRARPLEDRLCEVYRLQAEQERP